MSALEFFVPCVPPTTTAQMKRVNLSTGTYFKNPKGDAAVATYHAVLMPHRPAKPIGGALRVEVRFTWPWRKTESKRNRAAGTIPHTVKPDADNIVKALLDVLKSLGFFGDDAAVADLIVRKRWGDRPGVYVRIETLEEGL